MTVRKLCVYIDTQQVGSLSETDSIWQFDYDPQWAARADSFDLSPAFPRSQLTHLDGATTNFI